MPLLEVRGLGKSFPGVIALDGVDLEAEGGEVVAVVGANGAGKSTFMNILAGVFPPTAGEARLAGAPLELTSPAAARAQGISIVYQESSAIPELTVAENIFLGREPRGTFGTVDRERLADLAEKLIERFHLPLKASAPVESLSVAGRQLVELARALSFEARVLILDEPTSVLSVGEQENLFESVEGLKRKGLLILYVSHRLDEVFALADRVLVIRNGRQVATLSTRETTQGELVRLMTGHEALDSFELPGVSAVSQPLLEAAGLTVRPGEIVGLAGMVGSGRSRLVRKIAGLGAPTEARVAGESVRIRSPRDALRHGIVYLTEDRKHEGLFANLSVAANTTAAALAQLTRFGFLSRREEGTKSRGLLERLRLTARSLEARAGELSGGNQQKLLIARALLTGPRLLICDEPTRGVDVGAKDEIYGILIELAAQGVGVVIVSSELKELMAVTHRLLVMRDGHIVAEVATRQTSEPEVLAMATGARAAA